jgi:hypothetical protein
MFEILPPTKAALDPGRLKKYPLLQVVSGVLQRYDVMSMGAEASTPYLDTSVTGAKPELKEESNGHIYDTAHPRVLTADFVTRGGYNVREKLPEYFDRLALDGTATRNIDPWESCLPSFNIEGTSPGAMFIQPASEVHPHYAAAIGACRKVVQSIVRLQAPQDAPKSYTSAMATTFNPTQLPQHTETPADKHARISDFYKANIHAVSSRLANLDSRLAHFNFVDTQTNTRGVPVARLMRERTGDTMSTVALVSPYLDASDAEMKTLVNVASVIKNTQPASVMAHFPAVDRVSQPHTVVSPFATAMLRVGHPISDAGFAALARLKMPKFASRSVWASFTRALDNHSAGMSFGAHSGTLTTAGIEKLAPHLDRTDRTVYTMYAPAWAVANANMGAIDAEIKELYANGSIIDHAFWRDRFLQQCDDQITLALVVPVPQQ